MANIPLQHIDGASRDSRRAGWVLLGIGVFLLAGIAIRLLVGGMGATGEDTRLLLEIRGLRVGSAVLVGACLSLAGALLQGLLRNSLASPDLLGMASGAGLGVMVAIYVSFLAGAGLADAGGLGATGAAIVGACATLGVVYLVSARVSGWRGAGEIEPTTLVLMGVIIAIICSGAMSLLKHLMPDQGIAADRLLVGSIRDDVRPMHLWIVGVLLAMGMGVSLSKARMMDVASLSDDEVSSLGISLARLRTTQFLIAGVLTGGAVVLAGPVGFVGLLCPHVVRSWAGPRHGPLLVGSAMLGAGVVVGADTLIAGIREVYPGLGRLPLGVLTALGGGPIFLLMLRRGRGRS